MKKNSAPFLLMLICFLVFNACDKITAPYRDEVVVTDFCTTGIEDSVIHRKVLMEDYTGHLCGRCPAGGIFLNDSLKALYNHCLVVISVHAGFFATLCPSGLACPGGQPGGSFTTDFNTVAGTEWYNFFNMTSNPNALINRIDYPAGTHSKSVGAWASTLSSQLSTKADAKITVENTYNNTNRSVRINVKTNFLSGVTGNYKLQVVLTEDSIIDWQAWYLHTPLYVPDYTHRHVLRAAINSSWGELIASGPVSAGDAVTKTYDYTLQNNWNADHCNVVAFVYNDLTKEVLQVEEQSVK